MPYDIIPHQKGGIGISGSLNELRYYIARAFRIRISSSSHFLPIFLLGTVLGSKALSTRLRLPALFSSPLDFNTFSLILNKESRLRAMADTTAPVPALAAEAIPTARHAAEVERQAAQDAALAEQDAAQTAADAMAEAADGAFAPNFGRFTALELLLNLCSFIHSPYPPDRR
jgi:hypothetical protein